MTASQIQMNIDRLVAEAIQLRENHDEVEAAQEELEQKKARFLFIAAVLELAELIGDFSGYFRYAQNYRIAELAVERAKWDLRVACAAPHQWGRYTAICVQLSELRAQIAPFDITPAVVTAPLAADIN